MILVDDFTGMMWVAFLKEKSKAFENFKIFKNRVENESSVKTNCLRSYWGVQFTEKTYIIKDKDGKLIGTSTRSKGYVFHLNPTKMTCLVAKVDNSWLWHRRFYHIKFDNIMKVSSTFLVRDLPKIIKHVNVVCKECILAK